jgi:catechol 2,3-dioxygenase-like lactoylglutathione lyase family enzyme
MTDLDHVAVAVADIDRTLDQLDAMGATLIMGERTPGFQYAVARLGDAGSGMNLEVLTPWHPEENDFLARFLSQHGDGPHHLSFVMDDVRPMLHALREEGLEPVQVKLGWAPWEDGFVLAHGTVVQVAGTSLGYPPMATMLAASARDEVLALPCLEHGTDRGWWTGRRPAGERVRLERVVLATSDLPGARRLFGELLGGTHAGENEYVWPRGARLKLVAGERDGIQGLDVSGAAAPATLGGARLRHG